MSQIQQSYGQSSLALVLETAEDLLADSGNRDKLCGSMVKQAIMRRKPGFNERFYGVRSFGDLREEAENRSLTKLRLD